MTLCIVALRVFIFCRNMYCHHHRTYHIVDLKLQNRLKVGTDKSKLKVKMQSVSDDDAWKRLLEKPRILSWGRKVYSDWEDVTSSGREF